MITIKNQAEWDALPKSFKEFTIIRIECTERITISSNPKNSRAELWGSSRAELRESSSAVLRESSSAVLWESSSAVLRESSSAVLRESSRAELRESSRAELRESSSAVLWESSSAVLWESSAAWNYSVECNLILWAYAIAYLFNGAKAKRAAKTATIITPKKPSKVTTAHWLKEHGVTEDEKNVVLFKRVSNDFKTQEGTQNETAWLVGSSLEHKDWNPKVSECGAGKFHAVPSAYLADVYRSNANDRYVAIRIAVADLYAWPTEPEHPHKIAFRKGTVLHECNRWGEKI